MTDKKPYENDYVFFEGTYITREEYNKLYEETYADTNKEDNTMKNFNYVDTDSTKVTVDEMKGVEFGLMTRAIRSLITGEQDEEVTIDGKTMIVTYEMPEMKTRIGDPLNGHYTTVFATTEEKTYLLVEINEFCNVVRAEFYKVE